jgi:hypothetical protein
MKITKLLALNILLTLSPFVRALEMMSPISQADCQSDYLSLMSRPEINITIAYGYFDLENGGTMDTVLSQLFIETMITPCKSWDQKTCGFKKSGSRPTILTRKLTGPDGLIKTVRIKVDAPSLSTSDLANQTNPLQKVRSEAVKKMFLDGLRNSEVTLYLGHSRDGGGPDFDPPRLKHGHTDYEWYHANPKDKKEMMNVLKENAEKSRIIGLFSCSSIRWFAKGFNTDAPASGLIGTTDTYYVTRFEQVYSFIEKIFSFQCIEKLIIDDIYKSAKIKSQKKWSIPEKDKNISQQEIRIKTLEKLALQLYSSDNEISRVAYLEIKSYEAKYYSQRVWEAYNFYRFGRDLTKSLNE